MQVITRFDPWKGKLCTCPPKYSFSPYTGCSHACLYCYVSSYIPNFFECRPKPKLVARLTKDLKKIDKKLVISVSNSSDPYPPEEKRLRLMRSCLRVFAQHRCRILIITKSDLVARDADLLSKLRASVSFTITTLSPVLSKKLEPGAPLPQARIKALHCIAKILPVSVRIDPIIPGLNDEVEELVKVVAKAGAKQVVASTYKARYDSWKRMQQAFPSLMQKLKPLYFEQGEKVSNSFYLPKKLRLEILKKVKEACEKFGLLFSSCREGFPELQTAKTCDASLA